MDYYIQHNIGLAKYVLNFYDGIKKHKDGSNFYDIAIFHNKKELERTIKGLREKGYKED